VCVGGGGAWYEAGELVAIKWHGSIIGCQAMSWLAIANFFWLAQVSNSC
jgi:hypothetical protein